MAALVSLWLLLSGALGVSAEVGSGGFFLSEAARSTRAGPFPSGNAHLQVAFEGTLPTRFALRMTPALDASSIRALTTVLQDLPEGLPITDPGGSLWLLFRQDGEIQQPLSGGTLIYTERSEGWAVANQDTVGFLRSGSEGHPKGTSYDLLAQWEHMSYRSLGWGIAPLQGSVGAAPASLAITPRIFFGESYAAGGITGTAAVTADGQYQVLAFQDSTIVDRLRHPEVGGVGTGFDVQWAVTLTDRVALSGWTENLAGAIKWYDLTRTRATINTANFFLDADGHRIDGPMLSGRRDSVTTTVQLPGSAGIRLAVRPRRVDGIVLLAGYTNGWWGTRTEVAAEWRTLAGWSAQIAYAFPGPLGGMSIQGNHGTVGIWLDTVNPDAVQNVRVRVGSTLSF